jgi:hypothetical protein
VNVAWNATNVATVALGPESSRRVDIVLHERASTHGDDRLRFKGSSAAWQLTYLELANLHGSGRGLLTFVIVPAATRAVSGVSWPMIVLIAAAVFVIESRSGSPWARKPARVIHGIAIAIIVILFALSLLSGVVTSFKLLLWWKTFWLLTALLVFRGLWRFVVDVRRVVGRHLFGSEAALDSFVIACFVTAFFAIVMTTRLERYRGNYSGFLHLSKEFIGATPVLIGHDDIKKTLWTADGAYDGMFMYLMTYDPFLSLYKDTPMRYVDVVDTPPYRYPRIGFSLLTKLCSWDRPEWYPQTMMWLIIASHFVAMLVLGAILRQYGLHPAWALLYLAIPGFVQSLTCALPESIAGAGMLAGIWLLLRSRVWLAALCLAASLLVRETGALLVIIVAIWLWAGRRDWRAAMTIASALVPLALWRGFVTWRLFPAFGWETLYYSPGTTGLPFRGMVDLWAQIAAGTYFPHHPPLAVAGRLFPVVLTLAFVTALVLFWKRRDGITGAALAYATIAISHDYPHVWTHVGNAERVTFDVFLLLLVAFAMLGRDSRGLRALAMTFFGLAIVYSLYFSFDAELVRGALSPATLFTSR